ncbi:MAG: OmpA family protein [Bacteroidota bacterium]|nr:OmpA family protein [Bacteroidota bacterium]
MPTALKYQVLLLLLMRLCIAQAQWDMQSISAGMDVVLQGRNKGSEAGELLFQATWRGVSGASSEFQFQRMSAAADDQELMLDALMENALGAYLDSRIHFSKQGVKSDLPALQLSHEMNTMISSAIGNFNAAVLVALSNETIERLDRLVKIDWSQARFSVDGGNEQDKYLAIYYYVRSQREEFEKQLRQDLQDLSDIKVLGREPVDLGRTVQVGSSCGTVFDDDKYLCALDLQLADTGSGGLDVELGEEAIAALKSSSADGDQASDMQIKKRDRWLKAELDRINERIDKIDQRQELWELRDKIDDINDRLTGLEMEVRDGREAGSGNALADLSDLTGMNITIRFTRGSTVIEKEYRELLNEIFDQLSRSQQEKLLITGYTDRTGDPKVNLKLSELRAKAVWNYLLDRGLPSERLLINFHGESRSSQNDPSERRVEIEWLNAGN